MKPVDPKNIFLTAAYALALVLIFLLFQPYITFMFLGGIIVMFLYPLNLRLQRRIPNKLVSSLLMTLFAFIILFIPLVLLGTALVDDARNIYEEVINLDLDEASESISELAGFEVDLNDFLFPLAIDFRSYLTESIPNILGFATEFFIKFFLLLFVIYYGFKEGNYLVKSFMSALPFSRTQSRALVEKTKNVLWGVLYGNFLIALLQGLFGGLGFWLFGINNPVFWGFVMGILSFVPVVGTPLVWIPIAIYAFFQGNLFLAVGLTVYNLGVVMNIDNFLKPKLIGTHTGMHPLIVLVGILGGITLFGVIGFILGPVVLALSILIIEFFNSEVMKIR